MTIATPSVAEFTEKKSRFIGQLYPVEDEAAAKDILEQIRSANKGARHNVYAWIIGEQDQFMRSSDDGEPSGTGGRPVLESLKQAQIHNVIIVVTRYFGGILLGAGGLTRAYAKAAQLAIDGARKVFHVPAGKYAITIDYGCLAKAEDLLASIECQIKDRIFGEKVCLLCAIADNDLAALAEKLTELSNGDARIDDLAEKTFMERPV